MSGHALVVYWLSIFPPVFTILLFDFGIVPTVGLHFYFRYLSLYLTNDKDFDENELGSCPEGVCTKINVHILSGDRTDSDCLDAVHQKFDIANKMVSIDHITSFQ